MIERTFFEGSWVRTRRAGEILSSGRSCLPKSGPSPVSRALAVSIQGPSVGPLTG
jgi:hypothetical protein